MTYTEPVPEELHAALALAGIKATALMPITTGWDYFVYEIDGTWMLRVPRRDEVSSRFAAEQRLLAALNDMVPFRVPTPEWVGHAGSLPCAIYRKVQGRPLAPGDNLRAVGQAIAQLHACAVSEMAMLLDMQPDLSEWLFDCRRLWARIEAQVIPLLDDATASLLEARWRSIIDATDWSVVAPSFVHHDLDVEHLLMSDDGSRVEGMIDFGDATIGDPAIDFAGVLTSMGHDSTREVINASEESIDMDRLAFYHWLAPVHSILFGQSNDDQAAVDNAVADLRNRLRDRRDRH